MSQYDKFAKNWDQTRKTPWPEFQIFTPFLKKFDRILDLGCGNGRLREALPPELIPEGNFFGLDISEKLLDIARSNHPKEHFFKHDFAKKLPFGADNFDFIISIAAFHHLLNKKDQIQLLQDCYKCLKPGGKIFITTWILPKKHFWKNFWSGRTFTKNWIIPFGKEKHPRTYRYVSDRTLKNLLKKTGFKVIKSGKFENRNFIALAEKV